MNARWQCGIASGAVLRHASGPASSGVASHGHGNRPPAARAARAARARAPRLHHAGRYLEIVPGERLRHTDAYDDPNLPGAMTTTATLRPVSCGTDLQVVQEGIPEAIPAQ